MTCMAFPHALYFLYIYYLSNSIFPFKKVLCTVMVFNVELLEEENIKVERFSLQ